MDGYKLFLHGSIDCEGYSGKHGAARLDSYLDGPPTRSCLLRVTVKEEGMSSHVNYSYRSRPFVGHHAFDALLGKGSSLPRTEALAVRNSCTQFLRDNKIS